MQSDELARLRELHEKATPGPWRYDSKREDIRARPCDEFPDGIALVNGGWGGEALWDTDDAKLIVAMHAALPALLAAAEERDRLLGEVVNAADRNRAADMVIADLERTLRQERDNVVTLGGALVDRDETIATLSAEVERLRAATDCYCPQCGNAHNAGIGDYSAVSDAKAREGGG